MTGKIECLEEGKSQVWTLDALAANLISRHNVRFLFLS